jgi:hypothetical protein
MQRSGHFYSNQYIFLLPLAIKRNRWPSRLFCRVVRNNVPVKEVPLPFSIYYFEVSGAYNKWKMESGSSKSVQTT